MKRVRSVLLLLAVSCSASLAQEPSAKPAEPQAEIKQIILERKAASARGDIATWGKHIAEECVWVGDTTEIATKADVGKENAGDKGASAKYEVKDIQIHLAGDTAVAAYVEEDRSEHNGKTVVERYMYLDTYVRRQGAWQLIAASETPIAPVPVDPKPVRVDPSILDSYAGKYQWVPNNILTVWREGDKLMGQATGQEKAELLAENETTFFDKGQSWRMVFVKDTSGKVTYMIFRNRGRDFEMPQVK